MSFEQQRFPCQRFFASVVVILITACANRGGTPAPTPSAPAASAPTPSAAPAAQTAPLATEEPGTIVKVGTFGFGIVPDRDKGTRYAPDKLPAEMQQDGLRVVFSGSETAPDPNVRLWGTPFKVKTIRKAP
jgi:hypothetical protein